MYFFKGESLDLAPVVLTVDSAIHWIDFYPLDSAIGFPNISDVYPLDSDLSGVDSAIQRLSNPGLASG